MKFHFHNGFRYIHYRDVVNAIDKVKREARVTDNDASTLLKDLMEKKSEDSSFAVHWELDGLSNRLVRLCWMTGDQQKLYARYHDVLQTDNTFQTNRYRMPLTLFVVVDCEGRSRIVMQGIMSNETMESYKWMLEQLLNTTRLSPRVIISDADPALLVAIPLVFPDTHELHCIFHIMCNLRKRIGATLQSNYKAFEKAFLEARNCLSSTRFEHLWNSLLAEFPQAADYLHYLYQSKSCWAKAYTSKVFTAGIQSTSRTEGYNVLLKKQISSSGTLCDLAKVLDGRMQTEQLQTAFRQWQVSMTTYKAPFVATQLFSPIYKMLKEYVSSFYVAQVEQQMGEAMLYEAKKTTIETALQVMYYDFCLMFANISANIFVTI